MALLKQIKQAWDSWFGKMPSHSTAKRIVIGVIGGTVTLIGIALIVLPGPAFVVLPAGLSILASEFYWALRWLKKARDVAAHSKARLKNATHQS